MPAWESHNPTPPSLVYPPDGLGKWFARQGLPSTRIEIAPNGKTVCIAEMRGWLRSVAEKCTEDPDWHYFLVLDPEWLDSLGIPFETFLLPGDLLDNQGFSTPAVHGEVEGRTRRAHYGEAILHMELDGWQRVDVTRGQPPKPDDWICTNECNDHQTYWPYNPRNPKPGDPALARGQYVRVVGSLVTDSPHMMSDQFATNLVLRLGYDVVVARLRDAELVNLFTLGADPGGAEAAARARADAAEFNAVKWLWGPNQSQEDERHPARFHEIHSPDYIEVLPPKAAKETVRVIAVVAQNGLSSGDVEEISVKIPAPNRPSQWHVLAHHKLLSANTIASTVLTDEVIPLADGIRVRVRVQGEGGMGANGKFFAIYRVGWTLQRVVVVRAVDSRQPIDVLELPAQAAGLSIATEFIVVLWNAGPAAVTITEVAIQQDYPGIFQLGGQGTVVPAGATVNLLGTFLPPATLPGPFPANPPYTVEARVTFKTDDPQHDRLDLRLTGRTLGPPLTSTVAIAPAEIDFGQVNIGNGIEREFVVRNTGRHDITIEAITIRAEAPAGQFRLYTRNPGQIVPSYSTGRVFAYFEPTQHGSATAEADIAIASRSIAHPERTVLPVKVQGRGNVNLRPDDKPLR